MDEVFRKVWKEIIPKDCRSLILQIYKNEMRNEKTVVGFCYLTTV
jgi:hypothetical protein